MLPEANTWDDWLRVLNLGLCTWAAAVLLVRFVKQRELWNAKTRDYWFALLIWTVVGAVGSLEGLYQDLQPGSRLVVLTVASGVTLIGLQRRGDWGGSDA